MNRYDDPVKAKKIGVGAISAAIISIALTGIGWLYFKHLQSNAVEESDTRVLALPSDSKETGTVDPLSPSDVIDGVATAESVPGATDAIVELHQDASFVLPDLDHSDALLREEMTGLSPELSGWLNTDRLIRKYVVIANDFAQGLRLEKNLRFLAMTQPFAVDQDNEDLFIAAKSYQRYDRLAAAVNALDVQATLAVYKKSGRYWRRFLGSLVIRTSTVRKIFLQKRRR